MLLPHSDPTVWFQQQKSRLTGQDQNLLQPHYFGCNKLLELLTPDVNKAFLYQHIFSVFLIHSL